MTHRSRIGDIFLQLDYFQVIRYNNPALEIFSSLLGIFLLAREKSLLLRMIENEHPPADGWYQ